MTDLEQKIKQYADAYYEGDEQISDEEYDALIDQLRKENPDSELLPENQGIAGSDLKGVTKKYKLPVTMGTLAKCNTNQQMEDWWNKHSHKDIVAELKVDGNGVLLEFEDGFLTKAYSRGDGVYGEDRTDKVFALLGKNDYPENGNVAKGFYGWIRGEIYMKRSVFEDYFKDSNYKNPRNLTAGILGRNDIKNCDLLSLITYDVFTSPENKLGDSMVNTEQHKLKFLQQYGYEVPDYRINPSFVDLLTWKNSLDTSKSEIPCDGIVIKQNKVDTKDLMRITPENNVAFKPNLQKAASTIRDIKWQLQGRYLSPIAIVDPVELEGTTVVKASLANINKMNEKGVYIGAKVMMSKHGMIIPAVDSVIDPKRNAFEIPEVCPRCGSKLVVNESGFPECLNEGCIAKVEHQFARFFVILGIKAAGPAFIREAASDCKDVPVPFKMLLEIADDNNVNIFNEWAGGINGEKILKQLREYLWSSLLTNEIKKEPKAITAAQFCAMFDWPHLSTKQFEKIPNFNLTIARAGWEAKDYFVDAKGIGDTLIEEMNRFFCAKANDIEDLSHYFNIEDKEKETNTDLPTICFTGTCPGYSRKDLTKLCKGFYNVVDSVTKDLDILACADPNSGSSKLQKAAKNGTKVISYSELLETLKKVE